MQSLGLDTFPRERRLTLFTNAKHGDERSTGLGENKGQGQEKE